MWLRHFMLTDLDTAILRITLFGDVTAVRKTITSEENDVDLLAGCSNPAKWLFACLVLDGIPQSYESLHARVWPGVSTKTYRVRKYLSELRRSLFNLDEDESGSKIETLILKHDGHDLLVWDKRAQSSIQISVDCQLSYIDVYDFENSGATDRDAILRLIRLYQTSMLQGCQGTFATEWRERLGRRQAELFKRNALSGSKIDEGDVDLVGERFTQEQTQVPNDVKSQEPFPSIIANDDPATVPDLLDTTDVARLLTNPADFDGENPWPKPQLSWKHVVKQYRSCWLTMITACLWGTVYHYYLSPHLFGSSYLALMPPDSYRPPIAKWISQNLNWKLALVLSTTTSSIITNICLFVRAIVLAGSAVDEGLMHSQLADRDLLSVRRGLRVAGCLTIVVFAIGFWLSKMEGDHRPLLHVVGHSIDGNQIAAILFRSLRLTYVAAIALIGAAGSTLVKPFERDQSVGQLSDQSYRCRMCLIYAMTVAVVQMAAILTIMLYATFATSLPSTQAFYAVAPFGTNFSGVMASTYLPCAFVFYMRAREHMKTEISHGTIRERSQWLRTHGLSDIISAKTAAIIVIPLLLGWLPSVFLLISGH